MEQQPSYYSIITANVRYDNRLTDSEKLLFAEITSLSNVYGYCTASNGYFSKLYEVTKVTISRRIAKLKKYGYLKVEIIRELSSSNPHAECNYKITLLSPEEGNVVLLDYDGFNKKILTFRRGDWVNRLYRYFYHKERCYLQDRAEHPNFQLIQY